jgi:NADPH:quinone reductase-like Zn-dependent oxidoreductase
MRAIVVERPGGADRLRLRELPRPEPGPGEALIAVAFAGCNWSDIQKRSGIYPDPVNYPVVLGGEVSGYVAAVGPLTRGVTVGDRVAAMTGPHCLGGYAELVSVPAPYLIRLPVGFPLELGAAFPMVTLTAYHLVHSAYRVRRGEFVLVHAIGGSVGLMLTQMLKMVGARVMGTVGRPGKGDRAKALGADLVVDRSCEDFVVAAHEFTGGRGIDLVIDSLGSDVLERSFDTRCAPTVTSSTSARPPATRISRSARNCTSARPRSPDSRYCTRSRARRAGAAASASPSTAWRAVSSSCRSRASSRLRRWPLCTADLSNAGSAASFFSRLGNSPVRKGLVGRARCGHGMADLPRRRWAVPTPGSCPFR